MSTEEIKADTDNQIVNHIISDLNRNEYLLNKKYSFISKNIQK